MSDADYVHLALRDAAARARADWPAVFAYADWIKAGAGWKPWWDQPNGGKTNGRLRYATCLRPTTRTSAASSPESAGNVDRLKTKGTT